MKCDLFLTEQSVKEVLNNKNINCKFENVDGYENFDFRNLVIKLNSLDGSPTLVNGNFSFKGHNIGTLKGGPLSVDGTFDCSHNLLITLKGAPENDMRYFYCDSNMLTSLDGAPKKVRVMFSCSNNRLQDLEGGPLETESMDCSRNKLTTLKGAPKKITSYFDCSSNKITSFQGCSITIHGAFDISVNKISSLIGIDDFIKAVRIFECGSNPITEGGLGLLLINNLKELNCAPRSSSDPNAMSSKAITALKIIKKYLDNKSAIYDCQSELLDADLEEFAQI